MSLLLKALNVNTMWDDHPELLSIQVMELLNWAWTFVQRSCFKSSEAYAKAVAQNMKKAWFIIVLNPAHNPVEFDNLNAEVFNLHDVLVRASYDCYSDFI
jgi:hypothetical protein